MVTEVRQSKTFTYVCPSTNMDAQLMFDKK